ncbi:integrase core domain-containing protein [Limimaricola cinnabarinus]|uniref:Integrase catalytic domain-containing protein n=1 Tax=Limimaricola cinnabarinus TaxID=1125964 RepID=A0A2G1MEC7_9RHOB|nr:integrase core domain-containing protein [Limimaricola cinnabarinus]PHP27088.1 hypothetical protein CJ301_13215 [Limimaricola cinnabarinus]
MRKVVLRMRDLRPVSLDLPENLGAFLRQCLDESEARPCRHCSELRRLGPSGKLVHLLPKIECIDQNWFLSVEDARLKCEAYRHEYNHERPHSSIGNKIPIEFMKAISTTCPLMA